MSALLILVILALLLSVVSFFPNASSWPLVTVSVLLLCVVLILMVGKS